MPVREGFGAIVVSGVVFSVVYQGGVEVSREQKVPLPQEVTLPNVGSAGLYGTREGGAQSGAGVTGGKAGRRKSTELLELKEALQMHKAAPADRLVDAHFEQEAAERRAVLEEAARIQREVTFGCSFCCVDSAIYSSLVFLNLVSVFMIGGRGGTEREGTIVLYKRRLQRHASGREPKKPHEPCRFDAVTREG